MKKGLFLAAGVVIGLALLIGVFYLFPFTDFLALVLNISLPLLGLYLLVSFAIFLLLAWRWAIILKAHGITLPKRKILGYRYVGFAVSFVTPGPKVGGEMARAALMRRDKVSFPKGFSSVVADKTIELSSFGMMFFLSLVFALALLPIPPGLRATLTVVTVILFLAVTNGFILMIRGKDPVMRIFRFLRLDKINFLKKYKQELREFEKNILAFYGKNKKKFWQAQAISAMAWLFALLEFYLIFRMLGITPTFVEVFLVYSVVGMIYMIPIPLALGSLEAGQAAMFTALGLPAAAGAVVAMITRGRDLLWTLVGFTLLGYYGIDTYKPKKRTRKE